MLWLGPLWQQVVGGHPPDEGSLARLTHAKVASIQHAKPHLYTQEVGLVSKGHHNIRLLIAVLTVRTTMAMLL